MVRQKPSQKHLGVLSVSPPDRSLYLYFLDRELGDAVRYQLNPALARHAAQVLVATTNSRLIFGVSLLYENSNLDRRTVEFYVDLLNAGAVDVVSHYPTYEEFKASRVAMYQHDAARYPAYFSESDLPVVTPTVQKAGGTTAKIESGMFEWASRLPALDPRFRVTAAELRRPVLSAISERDDRAITFSLFAPRLGPLAESLPAQSHIRRTISRLFATDYRDFGDNDIPTGIRHLAYFEGELARDFPLYDIQILGDLAALSGLELIDEAGDEKATWPLILWNRDSEEHSLYAASVRWIITSLAHLITVEQGIDRQDEVRSRIRGVLRKYTTRQRMASEPTSGSELYAAGAANTLILASQLDRSHPIARSLERFHDDFLPPPRADVLLVVATEVENEGVIDVFRENGHPLATPSYSAVNTYQTFPPVAGARIALVRCSIGSGGSGGPELTIAEGIQALRPAAVIMVGIAFGVNEASEAIGDVLISTQVFGYDLERVGTDLAGHVVHRPRGAQPDASPKLIARFRAARLHTYGLHVIEGVLLSGRKLVDNVNYRDALLSACPECIGGEMEGYGLYAAASRAKVDWIIVKAICDWADGKKSLNKAQRQSLAARNAALAVLRTLERGGFGP
jgi:nucleoside phosphorylase